MRLIHVCNFTNLPLGRVTTRGSTLRAHLHHNLKPLSAQQVLFQRTGAPTIYAERVDEYNFAARLPRGAIPDSDLLKALHTYASDFYGRTYDPRGHRIKRRRKVKCDNGAEGVRAKKERLRACQDFKSMDETALLAMGVLMEEMMRESVGETGDLAFTQEGERRRFRRKRKVVTTAKEEEKDAQGGSESQAEKEMVNSEKAEAQPRKDKKKRWKSTSKSERRKSKKGKT